MARVLVDPIWWLFVLWLPGYLKEARGFSLKEIGYFAWLPYLAAAAGSLTGGFLAGCLITAGISVDRARRPSSRSPTGKGTRPCVFCVIRTAAPSSRSPGCWAASD